MHKAEDYTTSSNWIGKFLVAMPHLDDPYFRESVILLCGKDEEGAIGFIINHMIHGVFLQELLDQLKIAPNSAVQTNPPLFLGGPLDMERGFVIHSDDFDGQDTLPIFPGVCLSNNMEVLRAISQGVGPKNFIVCMGFASWEGTQLETEMTENSWILLPADKKTLFNKNPATIWKRVYDTLKVDPSLVSFEGGKA